MGDTLFEWSQFPAGFSSLITATAISWRCGSFDLKQWVREYVPLSVNSPLAAARALFIASTYRANAMTPLAMAPLIVIMWYWAKAHKNRLIAEGWFRENRIVTRNRVCFRQCFDQTW